MTDHAELEQARTLVDVLADSAIGLTTSTLADTRGQLADTIVALKRAQAIIDDELARRVDELVLAGAINRHTAHDNGYTIGVTPPNSPTLDRYDDEMVRLDLLEHADELDLPPERLEQLFTVVHKLRKDPFKSLAATRPAMFEVLNRHRKRSKARTVTVQRPLRTPLPNRWPAEFEPRRLLNDDQDADA